MIGVLKKNYFNKKLADYFLLSIPALLLIVWFLISKDYNIQNRSIYFLSTIRPIWETPNKIEIWNRFVEFVLPEFYHVGFIFLLFGILFFIVFNHKKVNRYLLVFLFSILMELILFILLWFANLNVHDYYLLDFYILIPVLFLTFFKF